MKAGINTFTWTSPFGADAPVLAARAKQLGFDALEVAIEQPALIDAAQLRDHLGRLGLDATACAFLTPDLDPSSTDPVVRGRAVEYLKRCVDTAAAIGAPGLNGPFFCAVGQVGYRPPVERAAQRARAAETVRAVAEHAAGVGLRLGLEPLNRYETDLVNTVEQALAFLDLVDHAAAGLMLDTYHMNIEERDVAAAIRAAGPRMIAFQACGRDRGAPGEDGQPWAAIRAALADAAYDGPVVIEAFDPENKRMALSFPLWRRLAPSQDALASDGLAFLRATFP